MLDAIYDPMYIRMQALQAASRLTAATPAPSMNAATSDAERAQRTLVVAAAFEAYLLNKVLPKS